jgi:hypothetical protein
MDIKDGHVSYGHDGQMNKFYWMDLADIFFKNAWMFLEYAWLCPNIP